jgi:hypothetical protein
MSGSTEKIQNRLQDAVSSLSPRDRMLLIILGVVLFLLGVAEGIQSMSSNLNTLREEIATAEENLEEIKEIKKTQATVLTRLEKLETQLKSYEKTGLRSYLEKSAQKVGIDNEKIGDVTSKITTKGEILEEKSHNFTLSDFTLDELTKYLYEIETSGYPLQIQNCNIRSRKGRSASGEDDKVLRVTMDISTYKLLEAI